MAKPRHEQINLTATPYYHVVSRCVRRTFLCGIDSETGQDYSHRKQWIVNRVKYLARIFAMNIAAYAVMSNHYHLVLHVDKEMALNWDNQEVLERGKLLFPKKAKEISEQFDINPDDPTVLKTLSIWRERLFDISWFMRCMNEPIARQSNIEDDCKGHFWEGRYKSQALLDEGAVLSAMVYVDLNPIRANICQTPEESEFTSIKERIDHIQNQSNNAPLPAQQSKELMALKVSGNQTASKHFIDFDLHSYLELVDTTGRIMRDEKKGAISAKLSPIMTRLGLCPKAWSEVTCKLEENFAFVIGSEESISKSSSSSNSPKGIACARRLYTQKVA